MFKYYTEHHHLDNLIWGWNNPLPEGYVGDEFCDIISLDQYPEPHAHSSFKEKYEKLGVVQEPLAHNVGLYFLTSNSLTGELDLDFGEIKPMLDWFN